MRTAVTTIKSGINSLQTQIASGIQAGRRAIHWQSGLERDALGLGGLSR